ncbi:MAG: HigA family addiction module antitoxin [Alphaproteobacteria bacterium]|nr:HigA family addiction module antitoxin [Alphaproteobacteria bacterium]
MNEETFNITIGEFLTFEFLEPMELSQNALAKAIGVASSRINSIIKGHTKITLDTDMRLCLFFEKSEGFFLRVQEDLDRREQKLKMEKYRKTIVPYSKSEYFKESA